MSESNLRIAVLLPGVLGTYGDGGNAQVLSHRAKARGLTAEIVPVGLDSNIPKDLDIYLLGGGEDTAQTIAVNYLRNQGFASIAQRKPVLAICAALQILGLWFIDAKGQQVPGLGVLDLVTLAQGKRSIGELLTNPIVDLGLNLTTNTLIAETGNKGISPDNKRYELNLSLRLTGFENHGGASFLGPGLRPLGKVVSGYGNIADFFHNSPAFNNQISKLPAGYDAEQCDQEGVLQENLLCTYMHGPLLARNPHLADLFITWATEIPLTQLTPLSINGVEELRAERFKAAL